MLSLFLPVGILIAASLITLSSIATSLFLLQLLWVFLGIGILALFFFFDWRFILNYRWVIWGLYAFVIILLIITFIKAPTIRNTKSWLVFGSINIQPVELAKIALILLYANYFSRRHLSIARWRNILTSFLFFAIPAGLVALQPDLGSALILFGIWFGFLLVSGLPLRMVAVTLIVLLFAAIFMWFHFLKTYQRERIIGVFYPETNALSINYNVAQSKIAIGSAGFWGKGYGQGSQMQLGFLPEPSSDFILAALIEEWGMVGGLAVIASLLFLIYQILKIGAGAAYNFEKFICLGTVMVFGLQFLLNGGSEVGLLPVIGVTFPFLSYGGSSLLANFFLLSIVNAIRRR